MGKPHLSRKREKNKVDVWIYRMHSNFTKRGWLDRFRPVPDVSFPNNLSTEDYKLFPAPQIQSIAHAACLGNKENAWQHLLPWCRKAGAKPHLLVLDDTPPHWLPYHLWVAIYHVVHAGVFLTSSFVSFIHSFIYPFKQAIFLISTVNQAPFCFGGIVREQTNSKQNM